MRDVHVNYFSVIILHRSSSNRGQSTAAAYVFEKIDYKISDSWLVKGYISVTVKLALLFNRKGEAWTVDEDSII